MSATPGGYFEQMYAQSTDPWDFETSWYERRKYRLLVASLPDQRYRVGFEPACSIGVLTEMLAERCDELHAVDVVPAAADRARERMRTAGLDHVRVRAADALDEWPRPGCDLLVLSEFLYYTPRDAIPDLVDSLLQLVEPGGTVAACHWLGRSPDHAATGEDVHEALSRVDGLTRLAHHREERFLLEMFRRD